MVESASEALELLRSLGASPWLVRHHEIVAEVASELLDGLGARFDLGVDDGAVLVGAALHDAGKCVHLEEESMPGHEHELAGERLLTERGVDPEVARFCRTHGLRDLGGAGLDDLLVAAADTLWKGARRQGLEDAIVGRLAARSGREPWEVFSLVDTLFEEIASKGVERLARSKVEGARAGRGSP